MELMVKIVNLHKSFKEKVALKGINLNIPKHAIYALLGPNGAGKTTTIRIILGIMKPTAGEVFVNGINVTADPKSIRGKIGILPQYSAAYVDLTPLQNIKFIAELNGLKYNEIKSKLYEYFTRLELGEDLLSKPFSKLSGGEQRAFSFIMAIITDKDFLILDEPTSGLDIARAKYIREIIRELVEKEGKTILLSSHIVSDLEELANYCAILKEGSVVFEGEKEKVVETFAPETKDFEDAIVNAFKNGNTQMR